jgi:hypothetical protein
MAWAAETTCRCEFTPEILGAQWRAPQADTRHGYVSAISAAL